MSDFKTAYDNFMTLSDHMMDCVDQEIAFLEKKDYKSLAQMLDYKEESYKSFNDIVEILQIFFSKGDYDKDLVKEIKAMVQKLHDRLQENHDKIQKAMQVNEKMMSVKEKRLWTAKRILQRLWIFHRVGSGPLGERGECYNECPVISIQFQ